MSIVTDRIYENASGVAACARCPDAAAKSYLVEALGTTLDSIDVGVIIVNGEARILHANQAAKSMLEPAVADRLARRVPRYTAWRSDQPFSSGNGRCVIRV
jgi:PAS domain-containing protein